MQGSAWRLHGVVVASYVLAAVAFTWPLPLHLGTHLTGAPSGDTGVYVWNQWVFQHEILDQRQLPYFTDRIFSLTGRPANLSLHNYTTFQDILALPLMRWLGVVTTFNLVYLAMSVLTAYLTFLLARHVTKGTAESWIAGLCFAWCPVLVTRGMGHFSVAAAGPLAAFLLVLLRTAERERVRDALLLGLTVGWATLTDVYFAIYCLLIALVFLAVRGLTVERLSPSQRRVPWALDVLLLCLGGFVAAVVISGGWEFTMFGRTARVRSLYTPVLVLTALAVIRVSWRMRPHLRSVNAPAVMRIVRLGFVTGLLATLLVSPVLYAFGVRLATVGYEPTRLYWRSSPAGVDLAALFLPNPNHPLAPDIFRAWLTPRPDAYLENVASIPLVALAIIAGAWYRGWRLPRLWTMLGVLFGLLSLGPFLRVAGMNTYVPGPWAILRYVPVVGLARTPARFTTVVMLAVAVLLAAAIRWLALRYPARRALLIGGVTVALVFELAPTRTLHSAEIPGIYRHVVENSARDARVLELPFGVRDGTSSVGNFTARSQYFQTYHQRMLVGGYLSRVSRQRVQDIRRVEMLDALITLSEGGVIDPARAERLIARGREFTRRNRIEFVVIDRGRIPPRLREFALSAFGLRHVETDGDFELYRPAPVF